MTTLASGDLRAGHRLDLARLDDDGAPPARNSPAPSPGARPAVPAGLPSPRLRFDPARIRPGAVDGGWWPRSCDALTELPDLVAALQDEVGVRVQRLSVHHDEWDKIPARKARCLPDAGAPEGAAPPPGA